VERLNCSQACISELMVCYCYTTTPIIDWKITNTHTGSELASAQFSIGLNGTLTRGGYLFTYNETINNSNVSFVLNKSLDINITCRNGGDGMNNVANTIVTDPGPPQQPKNLTIQLNDDRKIVFFWKDDFKCQVNYTIHLFANNMIYWTNERQLTVSPRELPHTNIFAFNVTGVDKLGRYGMTSESSGLFTIGPVSITIDVISSNATNCTNNCFRCYANVTVVIKENPNHLVEYLDNETFYILTSNITDEESINLTDKIWTTNKAIANETYMIIVLAVNSFGEGIPTNTTITINESQCQEDNNNGLSGGEIAAIIIVGVIVGLAVIIPVVIFIYLT
jgi:hypothetical protein